MVKVVYTWPGNHFVRMWRSNIVHSFTEENGRTLDIDRDTMYTMIREIRGGEYIKLVGDPKALPRQQYKPASIQNMWHMKADTWESTIIENEWQADTVVKTDELVDEILDIKPEDINIDSLLDKGKSNTIVAEVESDVTGESVLT